MVASKGTRAAPGIPPSDLIILVTGLASSWVLSPPGLQTADGSKAMSAKRRSAHRAAVVEAARRLTGKAGGG
jgi:hypothetical protein